MGVYEEGSQSYAVASSRLSIGLRKTGFEERQAAMVNAGSRHWKTVASISIYEAPKNQNPPVRQTCLTHFAEAKVERKHSLGESQ